MTNVFRSHLTNAMRSVVTVRRLLANPPAREGFRSSESPSSLRRPDPPPPRYSESVREQAAWQAERGGYSAPAIFEPFMRWSVAFSCAFESGRC
jgi:hypothetical protein